MQGNSEGEIFKRRPTTEEHAAEIVSKDLKVLK